MFQKYNAVVLLSRKVQGLGNDFFCLIVGGCSSGQAAAYKTAESTEIAETNTAESAETDLMTYMSSDGFQIKYDPTKAESIEVDEHPVQFKLTGDFSDNNTVTIKYITGKQPEEALYELTEPWGKWMP